MFGDRSLTRTPALRAGVLQPRSVTLFLRIFGSSDLPLTVGACSSTMRIAGMRLPAAGMHLEVRILLERAHWNERRLAIHAEAFFGSAIGAN